MIHVSAGVALVAACQGATASDLFDNVPIDSDASVSGDAAASSSSGSTDLDATASSSGAATSSSGAADAAADVAVPDLDPSGVFCSAAVGYCSGATPLCCAGKPANGALGPYACKAACTPAETSIDCDDDDDCGAGEVCCDTNNAAGTPQVVTCKAAAACAPGDSQTKLCDPGKPDNCNGFNGTAAVPPGAAITSCQSFINMAPGFAICIP